MEAANSAFYLKRFEETIQLWIDSVDDYTIDMLLQKPGDGSWALGQVFMHIIDDTGYFAEQIKLALATNEMLIKVCMKMPERYLKMTVFRISKL